MTSGTDDDDYEDEDIPDEDEDGGSGPGFPHRPDARGAGVQAHNERLMEKADSKSVFKIDTYVCYKCLGTLLKF